MHYVWVVGEWPFVCVFSGFGVQWKTKTSLLTLRAVVSPSLQGLRVSNRYKILRVKMQVCVLTFVGTNYSLN